MPILDIIGHGPGSPTPSVSEEDSEKAQPEIEHVKLLKRRLQCAGARAAKALKSLSNKVNLDQTDQVERGKNGSYAATLQQRFFTQHGKQHKPHYSDSDMKQQYSRDRARCVWSFLLRLKTAVCHLLNSSHGSPPQHVLHTCVCDDTNTKMRSSGLGRSSVYTVCNTVECTHVRFKGGSWEALYIPTPVRVLRAGKAEYIHKAFTSWSTLSARGIGTIWHRLGLQRDAFSAVPWKTCVFIGDALRANDSAWRIERMHRLKAIQDNVSSACLGLRLKCCNHQLSLVRKPTVLSVKAFWTTLVRLGHLFEQSSFRRSLASAFVSLLQKPGMFIRALALATTPLVLLSYSDS